MKKLILAVVAGTMTITCLFANVQAAGKTSDILNTIQDKSEIHILYNDAVVQYEDVKPVNTDGRVMIPFRAALENMGAAVGYDETTRTVTAKKGDIEISFILMDDTIYIDKNGEKSTMTMDVPMIIVSDRTLVPIRFMSNAFGMQVGWDGDTETVIIIDYEDYADKCASLIPNFDKLASAAKSAVTAADGIENIVKSMGLSEKLRESVMSVLEKNKNNSEVNGVKSILSDFFNSHRPNGDADINTTVMFSVVKDLISEIDKHISVTTNDKGESSGKINLTNDEFIKIIKETTYVSDEDIDKTEIKDGVELAQALIGVLNKIMER